MNSTRLQLLWSTLKGVGMPVHFSCSSVSVLGRHRRVTVVHHYAREVGSLSDLRDMRCIGVKRC